ncbi:MAG: Asp-tRNA(Asn)/Glu-tRNA(Gln) amidotransferase subunit GatC [Deltaproteobacteria bacterium]|jgi:aspartyl-tRNA(Asn)/glutamyl-tRNA(Gln) amidotransferase subunit C|nr:Asp-tRNA(Asn)/Glu-tRNA(Gln) amidotransferase subunit GatC [Deltaproteobacteria bacterium]MDA8308938.1 Asp-tRNA(Asn)/Glu-tRNA(Gln) amidotransferase subunit GatC [Deltaproteobacteria bacterium]
MDSKITRDEVRHVALLARLQLSDAEEEQMTGQMNNILEYMDKLNELDTKDVEPTTHAIELRNVFRPDRVEPSLDRKDSLGNAPGTDGVNFVVPRVL